MTEERRQFQRVQFDSTAKLSKDAQDFDCQIIDLSIHGVLLRPHGVINAKANTPFELEIPLSDADSLIKMQVKLAHQSPDNLGFVCDNIDLDSITHLRKLVELNLGDSEVLERDLATLCRDNDL